MNGADMIALERQRQISVEGWTPGHDAEHRTHELTDAARSYISAAVSPGLATLGPPMYWPWDRSWWKPSDDPIRNLVKAGALIAAEIDRLQALGTT